jgi:hypothetical protein
MGGTNGQNKAISSWLDDGSRMTGDCHDRFWEGLWVRFPRATRLETILGQKASGGVLVRN